MIKCQAKITNTNHLLEQFVSHMGYCLSCDIKQKREDETCVKKKKGKKCLKS